MSLKILVVDDEQEIREPMGRKLRREGFDVVLSSDGLEGSRAAFPRLRLSSSISK